MPSIGSAKVPKNATKPCFGFFLQGSVKETAIANTFVSIANMIIFAVGIVEYIPRSHEVATNKVQIAIRPVFWAYYYLYWGLEIYMSVLLGKAARRRDRESCCRWLLVEIVFFCIWIACFALHRFWLHGMNPVLQACFGVLSCYKLYSFWVVYSYMKELDRCGGLNKIIETLSEEDVAEFFHGNTEARAAAFSRLPYNPTLEIPLADIWIEHEIGRGVSAVVFKAIITKRIRKPSKLIELGGHFGKDVETITVALKRKEAEVIGTSCFKSQLAELKIMIYLGSHPNLVNLIGACTGDIRDRKLDILVEYCPFNNLEKYLGSRKALFQNQVDTFGEFVYQSSCDQEMSTPRYSRTPFFNSAEFVTTQDLLKWSLDIARGVEFLHSKHVVHADLAARNILLSENKVAKISDFGFSRTLYSSKPYVCPNQKEIPWRWMAPESLQERLLFFLESDIWSYGVTLWEIFSLGDPPYPFLNLDHHFLQRIETKPLPRPVFAPRALYNGVMRRCWERVPSDRIPWTETINELESILRGFRNLQCGSAGGYDRTALVATRSAPPASNCQLTITETRLPSTTVDISVISPLAKPSGIPDPASVFNLRVKADSASASDGSVTRPSSSPSESQSTKETMKNANGKIPGAEFGKPYTQFPFLSLTPSETLNRKDFGGSSLQRY